MKNKIIILISLIIIIFVVFLLYRLNQKEVIVDEIPNNTQNTERPVFNTNIERNVPVQDILPVGVNKELETVNNIKKGFSNWEITKDQKTLNELINLSGGADNEALYEPWIKFFTSGNQGELIKIVNTSTDKKNITQKVYYIFEWFIYGSGEYENLSATKKQEILNQYNQLKKGLGIK